MAGRRKRRKRRNSGLTAFLAVIAVVIVAGLGLAIAGLTKNGTLGGTKKAASGQSENTGTASVSAPADTSPKKDGDLITGTIYDPANGIDLNNYEGNAAPAGTGAAQTAAPKAESEASSAKASDIRGEGGETAAAPAEKTAAAESAAAEGTAETADGSVVYVTSSDVNIRSGPGTDSEIVGKSRLRTPYPKTGESGDWTEIEYDGKTAYIKTEFVTSEKPERITWDIYDLDNERVDFGYSSANRDENNVPTDWEYYEERWGQFDADWIQDTTKNTIYLTMDEGFGNDNTITILDTLKEKGVNVTFFLTKNFVDERPELVQRMLDEGHQLGNHTCTHPVMPSLSIEDQTSQIMTLHNLVKDNYGYEMTAFRYPQGVFSKQSLGLVNNLGYKAVFWSYAYGDYDENDQPPVDESLEKALNALHNGAIYLLHASSDTNTAFLPDFIDGARERGFEFGRYPVTPE